eukprot:30419_1
MKEFSMLISCPQDTAVNDDSWSAQCLSIVQRSVLVSLESPNTQFTCLTPESTAGDLPVGTIHHRDIFGKDSMSSCTETASECSGISADISLLDTAVVLSNFSDIGEIAGIKISRRPTDDSVQAIVTFRDISAALRAVLDRDQTYPEITEAGASVRTDNEMWRVRLLSGGARKERRPKSSDISIEKLKENDPNIPPCPKFLPPDPAE